MAKKYTDHELNEMIFVDLPSDNESLTVIDDIDVDETYFPGLVNDTLLVMESDTDSDENVEILNI